MIKKVAKAALLTIVPILIHAFSEKYLAEEDEWDEMKSEDRDDNNSQ